MITSVFVRNRKSPVIALRVYCSPNPGAKGFNRRGLYRMKQFYKTYKDDEFVTPLVTQISRTNRLLIMSGSKTAEERLFIWHSVVRPCGLIWENKELEDPGMLSPRRGFRSDGAPEKIVETLCSQLIVFRKLLC